MIEMLRSYGAHHESQLASLFIPTNLRSSDDASTSSRKSSAVISFEDTLQALLSTDVLERDDGQVRLGSAFAAHLGEAATAERLATWLLSDERTGADPCSPGKSKDGAGDLAYALTWFLELDPLGPWALVSTRTADASPVARLQAETSRSLPPRTFGNQGDWPLFVRWSVFLGLAELRPGGRLDPDPTVAIDRVLDGVLPEEMSLSRFIERLGTVLPMYGGHLERSWHGTPTPTSQGVVPPSLANALLRLEHQGRLRLDSGVDEDDVVILEFGRFQPVRGPEGLVEPTRRRYARIRPEAAS